MSNISWRIGQREVEYIKEAIDSGLTGKMNQRLEEAFAKKFGVKYAIGVNSGNSALHCCLAAMGIGAGDEVIVPPLTFGSPAFAAMYQGAVPVFADVDPDTFTIDPNDIKKKITPRTRAIITVALYGLSPDMDPIMEIAESHDLSVIEDCAECYLGMYKGRLAGTIGDMAIFSFERSKHMTTGNGGIIITNSEELAEKARKFSVMGYSTLRAGTSESKPPKEVIQDPNFDRHLLVSPNYRLPEICAAMALSQLERLDEFVRKRIEVAELYGEAVQDCRWLKPQKTPKGFVNSYWTYAMKLEGDDRGISWHVFRKTYLGEGGDPFYAAWKLTYMEPALSRVRFKERNIIYKRGICPVAEYLQPRLIQLKTNYGTIEHAKEQAAALKRTIQELSTSKRQNP
jgi:perosamine synthetase